MEIDSNLATGGGIDNLAMNPAMKKRTARTEI